MNGKTWAWVSTAVLALVVIAIVFRVASVRTLVTGS
jgi:hypothetical protein